MSDFMKPTLHINGSSASVMTEDYIRVLGMMEKLLEEMKTVAPHGRDYYPQGDQALSKALEQHKARLVKLTEVKQELFELALHCSSVN